jgi:hypothetical protein
MSKVGLSTAANSGQVFLSEYSRRRSIISQQSGMGEGRYKDNGFQAAGYQRKNVHS